MATKIWYPERGDRIILKDGRIGYVTPTVFRLNHDGDSWDVVASVGYERIRVNVAFNGQNGE